MKTKKLPRLLAALLCLVVLLAACQTPSSSDYTPDQRERRTIPYSEMTYARPDLDAIKAKITELTASIAGAASFDEMLAFDEEASALMEEFNTANVLAMLAKYHDITDSAMEEEYRILEDAGVELSNLINELNRAIIDGPYAADYRKHVGNYVYQSMQDSLRLNSPEVEALKQQRNQLDIDYNNMISELTLEYEGQQYTEADILALDDYDLRLQLYSMLYSQNAETYTDLYRQMVEIDKEVALKLGFDSAADMYYLSYSRDYTPADAMVFAENSKELFAPLVMQVYYYGSQYESQPMELDKTFELMPTALEKVDSQLVEAWNSMIEYGLYDYEPLPNKQDNVAFNVPISQYDASFCYGYWKEDFTSATTVMHEFGHYYDNWLHFDESVVFNLDIAETYSQGLELLMQEQFSVFTDNAKAEVALHLQDFIQPLTYQILLEEFQQKVYAMDSFDANTIAGLYTDLLDEYGFGWTVIPDENGLDHTWYSIPHLFDSPFYTVSYWTSAVIALQIWAAAQDDWAAGRDMYMAMIRADQNQPFTKLVEGAGMKAPSDKAVLQDIASEFNRVFR